MSAVTARQLRFGAELRKLRERAGLNATEAAGHLGMRQSQISNLEAGRIGASAERVRALAALYECTDQPYVDALAAMTGERRGVGWWEGYRELLPAAWLDLAELEHHAHTLRGAITVHIPGLLQTPEHAREVFRQAVPALPPPEIEHRVSFRVKRQRILYADTATPYQAIVHEAALRIAVGGAAVAGAQLKHLLEMSEHEHISVRSIPFSAGAVPGSGQSIYYAHGPVPQLDTVHLDQSHGLSFLDAEPQLDKYRTLFERLETIALSPARTRQIIHAIARNL
ncbi:transcriptional regulator [Streptomyces lavendulae subsp. lavendulae]|uniref:helix-turn-helix domain-containing protein n=1 Tax=Streptomyces lavendulae TaxID=1914 RepID=UPI0024A4AF6B|nr:helix-turn-helix transcriptional regulator [Streptomyces lavendulae]GLV87276.1 transcriptional regulator [Streptomyces lavendulae subsp. lavendulae]